MQPPRTSNSEKFDSLKQVKNRGLGETSTVYHSVRRRSRLALPQLTRSYFFHCVPVLINFQSNVVYKACSGRAQISARARLIES